MHRWLLRPTDSVAATVVLAGVVLVATTQPAAAAAWQIVPSPNSTATIDTLASAWAVTGSNVWAVGYAYGASSTIAPLIEQYTGSGWHIVASPLPAGGRQTELFGVSATSATDVWTVGNTLTSRGHVHPVAEHFDGTSWTLSSAVSTLQRSGLSAVATVSPGDVWAVGGQSGPTASGPPLIEHYNGTNWSVVPGPISTPGNLEAIAKTSASDVWAVGSQWTTSIGATTGFAAHYDGTSWSASTLAPPGVAAGAYWSLDQVSADSPDDVWATGTITAPDGMSSRPVLEHFDGRAWTVQPNPQVAPVPVYNSISSILALSRADVWAIGLTGTSSGVPGPILEHYNGTSWALVASLAGSSSNKLSLGSLTSAGGGQLWSVGSVGPAGAASSQTLTARYS